MRPEKKIIENEYRERISRARVMVITEFKGLSSQSMNRLRRGLDALSADYLVVNNRLLGRALQGSVFGGLAPVVGGQTAVALGGENVPELAKFLVQFMEEEEALRIRGGLWGKDRLDLAAIKLLARLPSPEVLLSQVIFGIQTPIYSLVSLLHRLISGLVYALAEIGKKRAN